MNRKLVVAMGCSLVAVLLISTLASFILSSRAPVFPGEPRSLSQLTDYPGMVRMHELTPQQIETEIISLELTGTVGGMPVQGASEIKQQLSQKGYIQSFFDVFFDVFTQVEVTSPDGLSTVFGYAFKGWSRTMLPDGTKALIVGITVQDLMTSEQDSMMFGVPTNVLPPEQMPGLDPYIIWNAEPYFFIQHYWWNWYDVVYPRIVYWKYWWYDSHKSPNWFWGPYWWWRTYVVSYFGYYRWYWWWWWSWYYWRGWYWWSTEWPYY